jgi:hypothetical protein
MAKQLTTIGELLFDHETVLRAIAHELHFLHGTPASEAYEKLLLEIEIIKSVRTDLPALILRAAEARRKGALPHSLYSNR